MGFADDIKKWAEGVKAEVNDAVDQVEANAEKRLQEVLGEDRPRVKSIVLDVAVGKFHSVDALYVANTVLAASCRSRPAPPRALATLSLHVIRRINSEA